MFDLLGNVLFFFSNNMMCGRRMNPKWRTVCVEGNIGGGKTKVVQYLKEVLVKNVEVSLKRVKRNV